MLPKRKVYVAWKRKMLHDVSLHDVIGGHQAYIHREIHGTSIGASNFASTSFPGFSPTRPLERERGG